MICCVRSATITASSVGSAYVSSMELVCSDCIPPRTAARACSVTRTILFCACCAVSDTPAVWVWNRSHQARGDFARNRSRMIRAHSRRAARNLAISSKKLLWQSKKKESRGAN